MPTFWCSLEMLVSRLVQVSGWCSLLMVTACTRPAGNSRIWLGTS